MPNQIARLRKKGFLDEAHQGALELMREQSDDIRVRRAYAWVLYDLTKKAIRESEAEQAFNFFETYENLELTPEDVMLHDNFTRLRPKAKPDSPELLAAFAAKQEGNFIEALDGVRKVYEDQGKPVHLIDEYAWAIFRLFKNHLATRPFSTSAVAALLNEYRQIAPSKSSVLHSQFLRLILKITDVPLVNEDGTEFDMLDYLEWWDIDHLRADDFKPFVINVKGKDISVQPVAASIYAAITTLLMMRYDKAINLKKDDEAESAKVRMEEFLEKINAYIKAHPNYEWLPYYRLKMEIALGIITPKTDKELNSLIRRKRKILVICINPKHKQRQG